ncbi:hypothetical protein J6590_082452 [Homalodisca vitripennis]|nr:hypothetical protein J6590_082452 [Homalodisca vitripennis]
MQSKKSKLQINLAHHQLSKLVCHKDRRHAPRGYKRSNRRAMAVRDGVSLSPGDVNHARVCSCQFQCGELTHDEKKKQFVEFYKLNYNKQRAFLANACTKVVGIARRRVSDEDISSRHCTAQYFIPRRDANGCLDPNPNIKRMWKLFLIIHPQSGVSLYMYRDVFNSNFKLRFGVPRSDTCVYCDRIFVKPIAAETEEEKNTAYKSLAEDTAVAKANLNTVVLCIDLQQNNNWRMIGLLQNLVVNDYFSTAEQKFMTTGYSFLPCDRDAKKSKKVYVPFHYMEIIANAKEFQQFEVNFMPSEDFKNMDIVLKSFPTTKFNITENFDTRLLMTILSLYVLDHLIMFFSHRRYIVWPRK